MTENHVSNAGFEDDWGVDRSHRALVFLEDRPEPVDTTFGEIFTPSGRWVTWFRRKAGTWDRPEVRDAWDTVDERRVRSGRKGLLIFSQYRKNEAGLMQRIQVEPGRVYRAGAFAHAWSNHTLEGFEETWHDGEVSSGVGDLIVARKADHVVPYVPSGDAWNDAAHNFHCQVGLDPYGRLDPFAEGVEWGPEWHIYNGYSQELIVQARATSDWVTVILRGWQLWPFAHNDAYWDDVSLRLVSAPPEEREYHRTVVLMSPTVTLPEAHRLLDEHWKQEWTYAKSADDAGINAPETLSRRVLAVKPGAWPGDLGEFFETYYPGVLLEELEVPPENGEEPPPPEPPEVDPVVIPTLHMQTMDEAYWATYIRTARPDICKVFGSSDVLGVLQAYPECLPALRHHAPDYNGIFDAPTAEIGAKRYLAQFIDGVRDVCDQVERDFPGHGYPLFIVEGLNETYPSHNEAVVKRARDLDIAHLRALSEWEPRVAGGVGQIAVGNPHESEYPLLVPLAAACEEYGGWMGYHAYWYANPDEDGLESSWQWPAGRWTEIDKVFVHHGYHVDWYGGEGGVVGGRFVPAGESEAVAEAEVLRTFGEFALLGEREKPYIRRIPKYGPSLPFARTHARLAGLETVNFEEHRDGWFQLLPHDGWMAPTCYGGNWASYEAAILRFCEKSMDWNRENDGRYWGSCLFTTGAPYTGWGTFQIK
jgi:hypothetical protein